MIGSKVASISLIFVLMMSLTGIAFADYGDNYNTSTDQNSTKDHQESHDGQQTQEQSDENHTQSQHESNDNKTNTEQQSDENNQNRTEGEDHQDNQVETDELNNENNNEKAIHQEDQQDSNNIESAIENKTVAAEVNVIGNEEIKSIDSNIDVNTNNSTSDSVSVTVDSKTESGPKVIVFNLNSTTIDVTNLKYLHIAYDGHSITPATDMNAVLHPKSTDEPSYAIIITQNGAQVLVSIPHFSNHTITLSNISKIIQPIPEFPFSVLVLLISFVSVIMFYRLKFVK